MSITAVLSLIPWKIAEKYYGSCAKNDLIFQANKPMLPSPDKIYPGQVLRIPPAA